MTAGDFSQKREYLNFALDVFNIMCFWTPSHVHRLDFWY